MVIVALLFTVLTESHGPGQLVKAMEMSTKENVVSGHTYKVGAGAS